MKNLNPFILLISLFFIYWISIFVTASIVESNYPGIEQSFLRIISDGIDLCPLLGILIIGLVSLFYKEWFRSYKIIVFVIVLILVGFGIFGLFFNHS